MQHHGTVTIETERLILRRFRREDAPVAFANWMSDDRVTAFLRWPTQHSVAESEFIIDRWLEEYARPDFYNWAIELRALGQPIGSISVVGQSERTAMAHIGYCIGSRWWGRGVMTEALAAVMDFMFRRVGVNRIESQHDPDNPASGRVMQKCGMQYEGTLRQADFSNRGIVDAAMYALLAKDYFARKGHEHE